ncbi:hypothetical protein VZ95_19545 [Elstera litoralis]|uniref:Uncharacterized protein n=1 Tax=Elstera litoralis TaxID=552518 RepID=A0A0F3IRF0_9PROT|nr:hypothetical protein VZ95_19545 [Elstera litoralis]
MVIGIPRPEKTMDLTGPARVPAGSLMVILPERDSRASADYRYANMYRCPQKCYWTLVLSISYAFSGN